MTPKIWKEFVPQFETIPAVNQVECNPFFQQKELRALLEKDDVKIEHISPRTWKSCLAYQSCDHRDCREIRKECGTDHLRFEVQEGLVVLPKSTNPERIAEMLLANYKVHD